MDPNELLEVTRAAARDAVAVHRRYLGAVAVADWSEKGVSDFVTHVDREAEAVIVRRITAAFPAHEILAGNPQIHAQLRDLLAMPETPGAEAG